MCGLDIAPSSYLGGAVGGGGGAATPDYSVALFADLPADATVGQRVAVTGESGLSGLVCVNTAANTWSLESVTCTYTIWDAVELGATPGRWYNSGGITVDSAEGCIVTDTTNLTTWLWSVAQSVYVPPRVYQGTIAGLQTIVGDDATPSGWTPDTTAGGGTATITPTGQVLRLLTSRASVGASTASLAGADASFSSAGNVYVRAMVQAVTATGRAMRVGIAISDGTDGFDFGTSRSGGTPRATGQWYDPTANNYAYTAQSGSETSIASAMTLLEMMKIGTRCMARAAGGVWLDIAGSTVRNSAAKTIDISSVCNTDTTQQTDGVLDIHNVRVMRF